MKEEKIIWRRKKSTVLEKNEDQKKTAEKLMTQITKDLKEEVVRTEEPAREEKMKDAKKIKPKKLVQTFVG